MLQLMNKILKLFDFILQNLNKQINLIWINLGELNSNSNCIRFESLLTFI